MGMDILGIKGSGLTRWFWLFVLMGLVVSLTSCGGGEEVEAPEGAEGTGIIPAVEAVEARFGRLPMEERLSGIVRSQNQVEVVSRITALTDQVFVQNGDPVEKGDLLVKLSDREYREQLRQAEANLRIANARLRQAEVLLEEERRTSTRQKQLFDRGLLSDVDLEQTEAALASAEAGFDLAEAQVEQAEATVEERKENLAQTEIRSPVRGTVGNRNVEPGMQVSPGSSLFTVGDLNDATVTVNLTERMLSYIEVGQTVQVVSDAMEDTFLEGAVSRISPFLGEGNFSTEAEIDLANTSGVLIPGMFVTVDIFYGESEQATIIPLSAIYRHPRTGITGVYVSSTFGTETPLPIQTDTDDPGPLSIPTDVEFRPVQVVAKGRESAGVTGIQSGEWVVTVGQNLLIGGEGRARIRPLTWERMMSLQRLQPSDLLKNVMESRTSPDNSL